MASDDEKTLIEKAIAPYGAEEATLRVTYAARPFAERHGRVRDLFPKPPARVLEVGAGIGVDAFGFAEAGYDVVAAEPSSAMRATAISTRSHPRIVWMDARLPDLEGVTGQFDLVTMIAVFMHLPESARAKALARIAGLMKPGALLYMSLRHGPVPAGRLMYEVTGADVAADARATGLDLALTYTGNDPSQRPGVTWTMLAFRKRA